MLNGKERLEFCAKCGNRKFDPKQGIVCGLTDMKPTFEMSCPDYVLDPKALVQHRPMEYEESPVSDADKKKAGRDMLFGALWFVGGLIVTIATYSSASEGGGRYIVAYGAIIAGAFQFVRGWMNNR
jgi:hypothetical protein